MDTIHGKAEQLVGLEIESDLIRLHDTARSCDRDLQLYVFGSATEPQGNPHDIDILVVYRYWDTVRRLRAQLLEIDFSRPLHIIAMSPSEEQHYDFIEHTAARALTHFIPERVDAKG